MKKIVVIVMAVIGLAANAASDEDYVGVLLWPYEDIGEMDGLALPILGMDARSLNGVGVAGLWMSASDEVNGLTIAGIGLKAKNRCCGVQIAPAVGTDEMVGAAIGAFSSGDALCGCDIAPVVSVHTYVCGAQLGGVYCGADSFTGFQCAALTMSDDFCGLQLGALNVTDVVCGGCQIGAINVAKQELCGVQIGVINVCPQSLCLPLINVRF